MTVHPDTVAVEQDWPPNPLVHGAVDRPTHCGRQWYQGEFGAFTQHSQDAMAVFLTEIVDARVARFEDPQSKQTEHGDQGEVEWVGGGAGGDDHRLELQMRQAERG